MTKPYRHWTVKPHGSLKQLDENMLTVEGKLRMPLGSFPRRMTVIRLRDRRLVIWSAIALDDYQMNASRRIRSRGVSRRAERSSPPRRARLEGALSPSAG